MDRPMMRGGTLIDETRPNMGARMAGIARMLGTPFLPWQRYVADVATELDPATGSFRYDTVVVTTPRQCGKSALVDVSDIFNASLGPDRRVVYSAQTGRDAEDHFKAFAAALDKSKLRQKVMARRFSNGNMSVRFANGSVVSPMAMTRVAGHGRQMDKMTLDEAFSLSREQGDTIMDAILPTMNTRYKRTGVTAQRWITSTEGTADSTWLNPLLDSLRAGQVPDRTCWFDFGVPEGTDPADLDTIMRWHPAAGRLWHRAQLADFRASFEDNAAGFLRAFGNLRDTGVAERIIPVDLWEGTWCAPTRPDQLDGADVCFGVAVDVDATATAISAAIRDDAGVRVQLIQVLDGTGSAPEHVKHLADTYQAPVCMDTRGPAADLHDRLDGAVPFATLDGTDYMAAGQAFVSALENGTLRHAPDPDLDESCATSARTWNGDAWRITRRGSAGRTAPLESAMLAAWGVAHRPVQYAPFIL